MLVGSVVFSILLLYNYAECLSRVDPLVDSNVGLIRGLKADDGDYAMFLGIPYAQVDPENPFGESTPQPKFEETFEAYDDSAICPQLRSGIIQGTPDCLQLSVYVPTTATSRNRLPVMIWVYGGAFHRGSFGKDIFGPSYLVKHDVIVVTFNYRVGPYGFMCLDTPEVPGNQGLKDQFMAMKWVKDNIEAFGGDANKITVFGESAGGHSIDLHLFSPRDTVYDKVIIQSGSSVAATVLYEPDRSVPIKIAERLGFETTDINEAISFLAKSDSDSVVQTAEDLGIAFKPCVEKEFDGVEPFLTSSWLNAGTPKVRNMPILIGFNEHELTGAHLNKDEEYFKNLDIVTNYLGRIFDFEDEELQTMKDVASQFYFGDKALSDDVKWSIGDFDSDFTYIHPIQRSIKNFLEANAGNIFYYMFSYIGGRNLIALENDGSSCCASHADELSYLFNMRSKPDPTPKDEVIIERMTTMWTNFAKFSDPTPQTSDLLPVKWVPLTKDAYNYMHIDDELSLGSRPAHDRMAFWDLFYKLNENKQRGL
ncbi:hypothetical protein PYW07_015712 [Mythimna separata]|uniref:Carboxylic ester hydrolase n=1 Tax=Mythimna separata TaxID=271217 RepID=A0AAD7YSC6_MYTSE|nr:hypothetical protein PYW07_015712 [Mythimna separata]